MVFSSIIFLFYFLPAILILYYLSSKKHKNLVLFIGSLFFYAWGEPVYVSILLLSTAFNYFMGMVMEQTPKSKKKAVLTVSVVVNLAFLVFFKYTNFLIDTVNLILPHDIPTLKITLPIGISFFTFQAMSYVVDVYRGDAKVQKKYVDFATYITLFPQLIAGPIVRYNSIDEQLSKRRETIEGFTSGITTFTAGLAKKVLLANNIGLLWESISHSATSEMSVLTAWLGVIAYAFQIYFDFSGYSDMAIGLGKMFGFEFEKNFNYPYISRSITEFWRRWHISLSTWFKEYVYIPLGGNRLGKRRMYINLFIVWTLTGVWHGAGMNFVFWGIYYALILIFEKGFLMKYLEKIPGIIRNIYTMILVLIGWVLFASSNFTQALSYIGAMFGIGKDGFSDDFFIYNLSSYKVLLVVSLIAATPLPKKLWEKISKGRVSYTFVMVAVALILCVAYLIDSSYNPFLYFRF